MRKPAIPIAALALLVGLAGVATAAPPPPAAEAGIRMAAAEEQTVVFAVENMTCALCPVTVRKAMAGVDGVRTVEIDNDAKTATVVFDPAATTPEEIATAAGDAGYPARPAP